MFDNNRSSLHYFLLANFCIIVTIIYHLQPYRISCRDRKMAFWLIENENKVEAIKFANDSE